MKLLIVISLFVQDASIIVVSGIVTETLLCIISIIIRQAKNAQIITLT